MLDTPLPPVRTLEDLTALALALGCTPAWEEIPAQYWLQRPPADAPRFRSALIGRMEKLPWFGFETPDPTRMARDRARQLLRRGEPAALIGWDPAEGRLVMSVAFEGVPLLTLLPAPDPDLIRSCLRRIREANHDGAISTAARLADALAAEGISTRFFVAFEAQLERMAAALPHRHPEERRSLALLQLNRVLFLYFVQSKGWLDGNTDFLRIQLDHCLSRRHHLHRHLLSPLFFGTLNRPLAGRSKAALRFGRVPFLNGGLFDPHPLERGGQSNLPNPVWRDAFDNLFERFHFTASEGASAAIAPDMLGRVFERVMLPIERRRSGSFYTPPTLVRALLDECLVALAIQRLGVGASVAERMLADRDPATGPLLHDLALLDPAVGSGAFLLCALEQLADLTRRAGESSSSARRRILQTNLFGVDVNPTAVRLTELRLWLAVIAEDASVDPETVLPLPNLDCLVRQGDSLTDPLGLAARMPFRAGGMGSALATLRLAFSSATGADKRDAAKILRNAELAAMRECLELAERQVDRGIGECLQSARARDLFGQPRGVDKLGSKRLANLRRQVIPIRQARRQLEQDGTIGWFQYESHFADVFSRRGGFDLVVGNPPWVRAEKLAPVVREQLSGRYHWWRGDGARGTGYRHQPDLAVAFLERAHELAAPGGVVGLLLPAKIATAGYGATTRRAMARDLTVHCLSDLSPAHPNAFDATVYPMALVSGKRKPPPDHVVRLELGNTEGQFVRQQDLAGGAAWILRDPAVALIGRELARRFPSVGERFTVRLGVKTGANHAFLHPPDTIEQGLVRPAFRGRDVRPFRVFRNIPMFWPCDANGAPLAELPPSARAHVKQHEKVLRARADLHEGPPWTVFRTAAARAEPKVVWADLSRRLTAVALTEPEQWRMVPLNTCYLAPCPDSSTARALAGWLNSTWIRTLARLSADPASSGFARFNGRAVGAVPLPDSVARDHQLVEWVARAETHASDQAELDDLTAPHLDLPPSALRIFASVARDGAGHRR